MSYKQQNHSSAKLTINIRDIRSEAGIAYIAILFMLIILSLLSLAFLQKIGTETSTTMNRGKNMQAHYLAETAANHAMWRLLNETVSTVDIRVSNNNDDAEEFNNTTMKNDNHIVAGKSKYVAVRFNVNIPPGASVTSAYIEVTAIHSHSENTDITIRCEDVDNAPIFTLSNGDLSNRTQTATSVTWNSIPSWTGGIVYQTPDLSSIIQEIVDRPGWSSGNSMVIMFESTDPLGNRCFKSHEDSPTEAPLLHIGYSLTGFPGPNVYTMHSLAGGRYGYKIRSHTDTTFATIATVGAIGESVVNQSYVLYIKPSLGTAARKMYWTDSGTDLIERSNVDGTDREQLVTSGNAYLRCIDLDLAAGKMYWVDRNLSSIRRSNLDGSMVEDLVTGLSTPKGIAVDSAGGKVYWTDTATEKIQRSNLDGSLVEDLITSGLYNPAAIELDMSVGKMYWASTGDGKIRRSNLDGSNVEDLVTGLNDPWGIALDVIGGKVYWTIQTADKIQRADLDGSNIEVLLTSGLSGHYDIDVDPVGGKMYWVGRDTSKIQRANLDGSKVEDLITTGLDRPAGIAVDFYAVSSGVSQAIISADSDAILGGLSFENIDLVRYNAEIDTATLFFDGGLVGLVDEIDAMHLLANGHIVFSLKIDGMTLGGLTFDEEDLVDYDPVLDTATLIFDGSSLFETSDEDVKSVYVMDNGHFVLSTSSSATLGGLSFENIDLVEYDPVADKASLFFDGSLTTLTEKINAVHVLPNGHIVISITAASATLGGLSFTEDDLVDYDPVADTATVMFDGGSLFDAPDEDIKSVHIGSGSGSIVLPATNLLYVVGDPGNLTIQETARITLMEGWGFAVTLIDDDDTQNNFDSAATVNAVAYISQEAFATSLGSKLTTTPIGIVNENKDMVVEFGFVTGLVMGGTTYTMDVDNSHYITSVFPTNPVSPYLTIEWLMLYDMPVATGVDPVGIWTISPLDRPAVMALCSGATLVGGGTAAGRRVQLPWGSGPGFSPVDINNSISDDGRTITRRAIEWAAGMGVCGGSRCDGTFRDEFNAQSFSGSDGTLSWAGDWQEVGESDGAGRGDVLVTDDESNYQLRIQDNNNGGEGVEREMDLTGASTATLTFDYRRQGLDNPNDYVKVEISANGVTGPWTEIGRFAGAGTDLVYQPYSQDISAYISGNTRIRFISSPNMGNTDIVWFDNVEICVKN